jgi:plastocyanin
VKARCPTALAGLLLAAPAAWAAPVELRVTDPAGRPLVGAVVFLESAEARQAARPLQGIDIVQADKAFVPAVTVVTPGTSVRFPNRDTVRHHVYSISPVKTFELKLYVGTPANPVVFDRPGVAVLGCNIHDTMVAWVVIVETPWFGQTTADGRWRWAEVPPGSYRLRTWHPGLPVGAPAADQPLRVEAGGVQAAVRLDGVAP